MDNIQRQKFNLMKKLAELKGKVGGVSKPGVQLSDSKGSSSSTSSNGKSGGCGACSRKKNK